MKVDYTVSFETDTEEDAVLVAEFLGLAIIRAKSENSSLFKVNSQRSVEIPDLSQTLKVDNQ